MEYRTATAVFCLSCSLLLTSNRAHAEQSESDTLSQLGDHLSTLSAAARSKRLVAGWSLLASGGLLLGGGIILFADIPPQSSEPLPPSDLDTGLIVGDIVSSALSGCFSGGLSLLCGALQVLGTTDEEQWFRTFGSLPEGTEAERSEKIRQGERMLKTLSIEGMVLRVVIGSVLVCNGGFIGYFAVANPNTYTFCLAAGLCSGALVALLVPSRAEGEWRSYQRWKAGGASLSLSASGGVSLTIGPGLAAVRLRCGS